MGCVYKANVCSVPEGSLPTNDSTQSNDWTVVNNLIVESIFRQQTSWTVATLNRTSVLESIARLKSDATCMVFLKVFLSSDAAEWSSPEFSLY